MTKNPTNDKGQGPTDPDTANEFNAVDTTQENEQELYDHTTDIYDASEKEEEEEPTEDDKYGFVRSCEHPISARHHQAFQPE